MDIEAPRPWSLQQEVMSRPLHVRGSGWVRWSLRIAGLDNTGHVTRVHRMGQAGRPGLEQVEGKDYCGPSLHGPDQNVPLWDCAVFHGRDP
jgi:hypothetical protein